MGLLSLRTWVLFCFFWMLFVGYLAWVAWPRLPLDSGADAVTRQLFEKAVQTHTLVHAGLAVLPPLIMLGVGRLLLRLRGKPE